jgi:hypothetical protein
MVMVMLRVIVLNMVGVVFGVIVVVVFMTMVMVIVMIMVVTMMVMGEVIVRVRIMIIIVSIYIDMHRIGVTVMEEVIDMDGRGCRMMVIDSDTIVG